MIDKESAAYKIGKPFRDDDEEQKPEQDTESVLEKVKKWLSSQFSGPSFGEQVSQELKKKQQLTTPKK